MKGRPIPYTPAEMAWLEANRDLPISDYTVGFEAAFGRAVAARNLHALRKRRGWKTGRSGRFTKGQPPVNKGVPCPEGFGGRHPNARKTHFRKGQRGGRAADNYKPIGTERLSREGYLERKINDDLPFQRRWRAVHLIRWEAINGPIPAGHCLKRLGDDKLNTDPSNWTLISRSLLPRLNGGPRRRHLPFDAAAAEVRPALLTLAKLDRKARTARKPR